FQKAAHKICEQIGIASDGRVDATCQIRKFVEQGFVEGPAHAVQPLKFVPGSPSCVFDDAGHSECIVCCELRIDARPRHQQFAHAIEIAEIRHRLARVDQV